MFCKLAIVEIVNSSYSEAILVCLQGVPGMGKSVEDGVEDEDPYKGCD